MLLGEIRAATQLWIITDSKDSDISQLCQQLTACNQARDEMLGGKISPDDFLEILAENAVDIDSYSELVEENLRDYV